MTFALKDLKANESRLKDINKVAEDLESEGLMAEEVQAVQQQVGIRILTLRLCCHKEAAWFLPMFFIAQGIGQVLHVSLPCTSLPYLHRARRTPIFFVYPLNVIKVVSYFWSF